MERTTSELWEEIEREELKRKLEREKRKSEREKKIEEHFDKHKEKYLFGIISLSLVGVILYLCRKPKKVEHETTVIHHPARINTRELRQYDQVLGGWPFPNINGDTSISDTLMISRWKNPLKAVGIETVSDLVKYIRENGSDSLLEVPGIGEKTIIAIDNFFRKNSNGVFHSLYF